jgi:colanic acid/amylovoran biosynthesis glycosyltransferase
MNAAPAGTPSPGPRSVAYVVNRYPGPSHSFIRREILALEALGCRVQRFSVRPGEVAAAGGDDTAELARTRVLLAGSRLGLLLRALLTLLRRPLRAGRALWLTLRLGWRSDRGVLRHLAYLIEAAELVRSLDAEVELLHAHFGTNSTFVAMLATELGGPPFSFTVHGPEEFERAQGIALAEKVARARFVAAISDFCRSQLWYFVAVEHWPKIVIVRCGVDATFLLPEPVPLPATPELLWVGRLAPQKGVPVLLAACRLLAERRVPFRLTVIGGGPLEAWARAEVVRAGLVDRVVFAGWRDAASIRAHLDASLGLVVASFAEGLPVVVMEAMARQRPVVATRIAAIPELVVPGETGWLVAPGRADQLAAAMQAMLAAPPAELLRLGALGRQRVAAAHDATAEAASLWQAMRGVPTGPTARG